jgi:hypothetical protein
MGSCKRTLWLPIVFLFGKENYGFSVDVLVALVVKLFIATIFHCHSILSALAFAMPAIFS